MGFVCEWYVLRCVMSVFFVLSLRCSSCSLVSSLNMRFGLVCLFGYVFRFFGGLNVV